MFYVNTSLRKTVTKWRHIQTAVIPPVALPGSTGIVLQKTGVSDNLAAAAVKAGIRLYSPQLDATLTELNIEMPTSGSGAGGKPIMQDKAETLVRSLHPSSSKDEQTWMVNKILGRKTSESGSDSSKEHLLESILGQAQEDCFSSLIDLAKQQQAEIKKLRQQLAKKLCCCNLRVTFLPFDNEYSDSLCRVFYNPGFSFRPSAYLSICSESACLSFSFFLSLFRSCSLTIYYVSRSRFPSIFSC